MIAPVPSSVTSAFWTVPKPARNCCAYSSVPLIRSFGATVTLIDEDTDKKAVWQIVGEPEADAKKGKISITSPLARALVGKKKGAQVEVVTPGGAKAYEVMKVEWK